jgi:diguanylate cyclase (GGDEF)-like protein
VNVALAKMVEVPAEELTGRALLALSAPDDTGLESCLDRLAELSAADGDLSGEAVSGDAVLRTSAGDDIHVNLSARILRHEDMDGAIEDLALLTVVDVTERRRYQDRLAYLVDHDVLTGLASRRRFDDELARHLERCRRYDATGAVLLLDLDNFKQVNDLLGHGAGDQLLISIGDVLRRSIRETDVVARLGGDEFAILLSAGDQAAAEAVAVAVIERIAAHAATLDGVRRRVSASVGVVSCRAAAEQSVDILALADMTMYEAKEAGRNQYVVLPEGETRLPRLGARLQWQGRMEEALETDRFELLLQPVMNLHNDRIESAEVLLRLRGEDDELIPPSRFLYIAERSGLITRIDAWVVEHSVALLARLREVRADFRLEVNLSGHSIGNPAIERAIMAALDRYDMPADALILEITETAAVADVGLARQFAQRMTALGCQFALDDFGAGFGSFYYLKHLFFDYVKIDGEFVEAVHHSQVDRTIMRSIVGIARDLGKQTVAEFVSEPEILEVVRAEGVDHAQGYLIGRPAGLEELVELLSASPETSPEASVRK